MLTDRNSQQPKCNVAKQTFRARNGWDLKHLVIWQFAIEHGPLMDDFFFLF